MTHTNKKNNQFEQLRTQLHAVFGSISGEYTREAADDVEDVSEAVIDAKDTFEELEQLDKKPDQDGYLTERARLIKQLLNELERANDYTTEAVGKVDSAAYEIKQLEKAVGVLVESAETLCDSLESETLQAPQHHDTTMKDHERLYDLEAIEAAASHGLPICKHSDPTEGYREGLTAEEAEQICDEADGLIHVDLPTTN